MAHPDLHFLFLQAPETDHTGTAAAAAKYLDNAIPIMDQWGMITRIFDKIAKTDGRIKTLTIVGHGLDDPSGPDDPATFISIGKERLTAEGVRKSGYLWQITQYFQPDAKVFLKACDAGTSPKLLQAFSTVWGGVKVIAWTDGIAVCDSPWCYIVPQAFFHRGITEHGGKITCIWNKCTYGDDEDYHPIFPPGSLTP
jgi:hypothetical protein